MLGGKHHFTPTGSVFDGWKENLFVEKWCQLERSNQKNHDSWNFKKKSKEL